MADQTDEAAEASQKQLDALFGEVKQVVEAHGGDEDLTVDDTLALLHIEQAYDHLVEADHPKNSDGGLPGEAWQQLRRDIQKFVRNRRV